MPVIFEQKETKGAKLDMPVILNKEVAKEAKARDCEDGGLWRVKGEELFVTDPSCYFIKYQPEIASCGWKHSNARGISAVRVMRMRCHGFPVVCVIPS